MASVVGGVLREMSERVRRRLRIKRDYDACLKGPGGELTQAGANLMRDVAVYCGAYRTTAKVSMKTNTIDPIAMAIAEGRRQAFLHMQSRLRLTDDQILDMLEEAHD